MACACAGTWVSPRRWRPQASGLRCFAGLQGLTGVLAGIAPKKLLILRLWLDDGSGPQSGRSLTKQPIRCPQPRTRFCTPSLSLLCKKLVPPG